MLLTLLSCRNDFTLEADFQDIPVAYAYLDATAERHFVRVQKAFLEAGGNAETNAGIPDSIYYAAGEATVVLRNLTTQEETELVRVNAEQFDLDREEGVFASSPNVLYTATDADLDLRPGQEIRLSVERPGEETAVAETVLLEPVEINRPTDVVRIDDYRRPLVMSWTRGENAAVYDVRVFFEIRELFPDNPDRNRTVVLEWELSGGFVPGADQSSETQVRFEVNPEAFYQFIGANLEPDNDIVRRFQDFDLQVSAAGREVLELRNLENANAGITSAQSLPRYTNLVGGIGLITGCTSTRKEDILFDGGSLDSLREGRWTRDLGFR
ncbi:MAG: hypothetical protein AAFN92_00165 [Bacteroidota bacterium]